MMDDTLYNLCLFFSYFHLWTTIRTLHTYLDLLITISHMYSIAYIHTHMHACMCVCVYVHTYIHTCMHACIYIYIDCHIFATPVDVGTLSYRNALTLVTSVRKRYCVLQKISCFEEKLGCIPFEIQEMLMSETRDEDGCLLRTSPSL